MIGKYKIKRIVFEDGSYLDRPTFIDYKDGEGVQFAGGDYFDKCDRPIGHWDPPGCRGEKGVEGVQ